MTLSDLWMEKAYAVSRRVGASEISVKHLMWVKGMKSRRNVHEAESLA